MRTFNNTVSSLQVSLLCSVIIYWFTLFFLEEPLFNSIYFSLYIVLTSLGWLLVVWNVTLYLTHTLHIRFFWDYDFTWMIYRYFLYWIVLLILLFYPILRIFLNSGDVLIFLDSLTLGLILGGIILLRQIGQSILNISLESRVSNMLSLKSLDSLCLRLMKINTAPIEELLVLSVWYKGIKSAYFSHKSVKIHWYYQTLQKWLVGRTLSGEAYTYLISNLNVLYKNTDHQYDRAQLIQSLRSGDMNICFWDSWEKLYKRLHYSQRLLFFTEFWSDFPYNQVSFLEFPFSWSLHRLSLPEAQCMLSSLIDSVRIQNQRGEMDFFALAMKSFSNGLSEDIMRIVVCWLSSGLEFQEYLIEYLKNETAHKSTSRSYSCSLVERKKIERKTFQFLSEYLKSNLHLNTITDSQIHVWIIWLESLLETHSQESLSYHKTQIWLYIWKEIYKVQNAEEKIISV